MGVPLELQSEPSAEVQVSLPGLSSVPQMSRCVPHRSTSGVRALVLAALWKMQCLEGCKTCGSSSLLLQALQKYKREPSSLRAFVLLRPDAL